MWHDGPQASVSAPVPGWGLSATNAAGSMPCRAACGPQGKER